MTPSTRSGSTSTTPPSSPLGFLVHTWAKSGQVRACGRLEDGRSFALLVREPTAEWVALAEEADDLRGVFTRSGLVRSEHEFTTFEGARRIVFVLLAAHWRRAEALASQVGATFRGEPPRAAEDWLVSRQLKGAVALAGPSRPGQRVDVVFTDPIVSPGDVVAPLVWASVDIETARNGTVLALALVTQGRQHVLFLPDFASEASLLRAANELVRDFDPDVITGWNVLDFDLAHLAARYEQLNVPFEWGRTDEAVRVRKKPGVRTTAFVPGRQVVDAMRIARGSGTRFEDQTLATVASHVLNRTKTVELRGEAKLVELDRLYREEPTAFCDYCQLDAQLVLDILEVTGLGELTVRRASLTGVSLDLAWTSIPVFERIFGLELHRRRILPPPATDIPVSGAAGGMVLDAQVGVFSDVIVFDFRSLYPSIIRTFGIDPLGHARAGEGALVAPNGARFSRGAAILPELITGYFASREAAQKAGDETASYVYKILMNSFYGVLGSGGCRYGRTELAGAITSFGRRCLEYTRDWFEAREMPVLYGDTDSVFVQTRRDGPMLARELSRDLGEVVEQAWQVTSFLTLRCDKVYRRFVIPPMRHLAGEEIRGRAKGYAGWVEQSDGRMEIEVKGMEAVRSDWTPLARRFQTELLEGLFRGDSRAELEAWKDDLLARLRRGELNAELVYRKILRRPAQDYTGNTPPQVKAARLLGWTDRKGSIEYVMTTSGPVPLGLPGGTPDVNHYLDHQLRPLWDSLLEAAGFEPGPEWGAQLELGWG